MRARTLAAWLCAALPLAASCGGAQHPRGRVLLVGIDGATLRIAAPMLEAGRLPNLAAVGRAGVYGRIQSRIPLSSPRIWTSIATGKNPQKHGILTFARRDADGRQRLYRSTDRRVHAIWNIASDAGLSVAVVNWWTTFPVERIRGVMISDHVLASELKGRSRMTGAVPASGPITHPPDWEARVARILADPARATRVEDPFREAGAFPDWIDTAELSARFRDDDAVTRMALDVEAAIHPDLLLVFLPGIDRVSHHLWGAVERPPGGGGPPWTPAQRAAGAAALRGYYSYTDALIGRLLERYGPDDLVMIVSDHGFEAGGFGSITGVHESPQALYGVVFARGPGIGPPAGKRGFSVNDVTPTILAWLGLPVADDMDGRPGPFLTAGEVRSVATYDTGPIDRVASDAPGAEAEMLEQLRTLGYLEHARSE